MLTVNITAHVDIHIHQDLSPEDLTVLLNVLAKVKALAQKAKALAAKY